LPAFPAVAFRINSQAKVSIMVRSLAPLAEIVTGNLHGHCVETYPGLLDAFPVSDYLRLLDQYPPEASYSFVGADVRNFCQRVESRYSTQALTMLHQMLVATCIGRCDVPPSGVEIPDSIWQIIIDEQRRILAEIERGWSADMAGLGDLFLKDLGFSTLRLLPNGAEVVEPVSGVPRRILLQGGITQFLDVAYSFYLRRRPFKPIFQIHASEKSLHEFTPAGWDQCYLRIAQLLEKNPSIPGVFGTSWFFDPALKSISPRLAYLRKPEQAGAKFYYVGPDPHSAMLATKKSPTRRRLFHDGLYQPTCYMLVWFREDLIHWARHWEEDLQPV